MIWDYYEKKQEKWKGINTPEKRRVLKESWDLGMHLSQLMKWSWSSNPWMRQWKKDNKKNSSERNKRLENAPSFRAMSPFL